MRAAALERFSLTGRRSSTTYRQAGVWLLAVGFWVAASALYFGPVDELPSANSQFRLPWWLLAVAFFLAESYVVHFHLRRDAHTFSLSEIPLVLGLFFTSPASLLGAQLLGAATALVVHRRQSPVKVVFNLGHFGLSTCLALILFHTVAGQTAGTAPLSWVAAVLATLASSCVGVAAVLLGISLTTGAPQLRKFPEEIGLAFGATVTNTSLALAAVSTAWSTPSAAVLLLVPTATLFLAYRAYVSQRQKHDSLEFLYQAVKLLHHAPKVELALLGLLSQARSTFRAEYAEITLFPASEDEPMLRSSVDDEQIEQLVPAERVPVDERLLGELPGGRARLLDAADVDTADQDYLARRGLGTAMVTAIQGESRMIGALLVGNRQGGVSRFDAHDARLFQALATQVSLSLEHGRLEQSLAHLEELKERLRHQAFHDTLTQLANRALFIDRVEHALSHRPESRPRVSVLFLDLDDFKTVNDSLGHDAGDRLLVAIADRIRACLRPADTAARLGGDEFAVLIDDADEAGTALIAERIIRELQAPLLLNGREIVVRASIGIAVSTPRSRSADELLRNADVAMYRAKTAGKGRYAVFEPGMHRVVVERLQLKAELERAVDDDAFVVHYQPFVDLSSGEVLGVEALVRWQHPTRGLVPPGEFIPLAEETGLIHPIGDLVLRQACRDMAEWQRLNPAQRRLSMNVNLSATQLQNPGLVEDVTAAIHESGADAGDIVLEITESLLMHDTELSISRLHALKKTGVRLAIDDFGTGYSSLGYLRQFPIDILKIAKTFVDGIGIRADDAAFAHVIIQLGEILDLEIIAEGIERREQRDRLRDLGCHLGQGFHFARPADAERTAALLLAGANGLARGSVTDWRAAAG